MKGMLRPSAKIDKVFSHLTTLILLNLETKFGIKQHKILLFAHTEDIYIDKSTFGFKGQRRSKMKPVS